MKSLKIIIVALILICLAGMVAAADISDMKIADGYINQGNGTYGNEAKNIQIDIFNGTNDVLDDYFDDEDDLKYTVQKGELNYTFNFTDGTNEMLGIVELVEIDGKNHVVEFWTDSKADDTSLDRFYDALEEFNKLNDLTPINPEILDD